MKTIFSTLVLLLLLVAIKVNAQTNKPTWTVDPTLFTYDGEIAGEVFIDTIAVAGGNGILGAFAGDECRGVKVGGIDGPSGSYVFIMRCYSNLVTGETITFKYYDPVTDKIYSIDESYAFESNMTLGDAEFPVLLHVNTYLRISRKLSSGWSWFSLNVENPDMSIPTVLRSLHAKDGDYIKNQTLSATYYNGVGWFGELNNLDTKEMYKIKLGNADTLTFTGHPVDSGSFSININNGWNWIGYRPLNAKSVSEALNSMSPVVHDYIKNQIKSSTFYNSVGWFGEMNYLEPLDGYMLRTSHTGTLTFASPLIGTFTDSRDGRVYPWVKTGTQTWMTKNLAFLPVVSPPATYSFTEPYFYVNGYEGGSVSDAKATANFGTYGVLYNWAAAINACPAGWHLPTDEDWKILEMNQGMSLVDADASDWRNTGTVGGKLKEAGTTHWLSPNTGATNSSLFTALAGGSCSDAGFEDPGSRTCFWSSTEYGLYAWARFLQDVHDGVNRNFYQPSGGFSVRCLKGAVRPKVTTAEMSGITETSAISGGVVASDGGAEVTARGVCWSTSANPTTDGSKTTDGSGSGEFVSVLSGLADVTLYYVRAYATNSVGTAYGEPVSFTTLGEISGTFTDARDGMVYPWVRIGTQNWMAKNLAYLPAVSAPATYSLTQPYYYVSGYQGSKISDAKGTANYGTYGALYNWTAALKACPTGWHLPTDQEWKILEMNQGMSQLDADATGWRESGTVGGKLKETGTTHWSNPNTGATNSTGFTAFPGGGCGSGSFILPGTDALFWSASMSEASSARRRNLYYDIEGVSRDDINRDFGMSVRCLQGIVLPTLYPVSVYEIAKTSATARVDFFSNGGGFISARGVCWSISSPPTTDDSKITVGTGAASFTTMLDHLTAGTTYYVRAWATNSAGTGYGVQGSFTTEHLCGTTFTDSRDGTVYPIAQIGTQTWMAANLAYLPAVSLSWVGSETLPLNYVYDYEGNTVSEAKTTPYYTTYGVLYNWPAAMTACPPGWHLPNDEEWKVLEMSQDMARWVADTEGCRIGYDVGGKMKELGTSHWVSPNFGANNLSCFTALPGGLRNLSGEVEGLGLFAGFWSSSEDGLNVWYRNLSYYTEGVCRETTKRDYGYSVRCLLGPAIAAPIVTTTAVSEITQSNASSGGNITDDGGGSISARGVCWSISSTATIADSKTTDGTGAGPFTSTLTPLTAGTNYYVRAYATNSAGTGYGEPVSFNTLDATSGTFTDFRDATVYPWVKIGTQTWMSKNLAWLPAVSPASAGSVTDLFYYVFGYEGVSVTEAKATANYSNYGVLYNWPASITACPSGWHLPTDAEWTILEKNLGMSDADAIASGWRESGSVGGKLKDAGTTYWISPNTGATNSNGFTALPGGYRYDTGSFYYLRSSASFWTATPDLSIFSWTRGLYNGFASESRGSANRSYGESVRCLKN
jgi:uncharacterized protein (TIGR02145 family)